MRIHLAVIVFVATSLSAAAQLSGSYTILPTVPTSGTNFASLLAAVSALNATGVSGPVTFDIFDDAGPFTETHPFTTANVSYLPTADAVLTLGQWVGSSAVNRVTFRAAAGESPVFDAAGRGMGVFWNGADFVTLEGIEIKNAVFDAITLYSEASHGQVLDAVIRRCRLHDCGGSGVVLYGNSARPQNTRIENNFLWNLQLTNAGGFNTLGRFGYISGRRHDFSRVIHNTFHVGTAAGSAFAVIGDMVSGGIGSHFSEVSNNIIVKTANGARPIYFFQDNPAGTSGIPAVLDANCYFDTSGGPFSMGTLTTASFAAWQTATLKDTNSISADPLLVNAATGDLHLAPASPCINLSALPSGVTDDIDGQPRIGIPDVGADEAGCATPEYQINSAGSNLDIDGIQGTACIPGVAVKAQGSSGSLNASSSNFGLGFEMAIAFAGLVPASGGAILSANGQILNIDFSASVVVFINGGTVPNFNVPFPGPISVPFTTPLANIVASIQMANIDPANPDGFTLSQGCELDVQ